MCEREWNIPGIIVYWSRFYFNRFKLLHSIFFTLSNEYLYIFIFLFGHHLSSYILSYDINIVWIYIHVLYFQKKHIYTFVRKYAHFCNWKKTCALIFECPFSLFPNHLLMCFYYLLINNRLRHRKTMHWKGERAIFSDRVVPINIKH